MRLALTSFRTRLVVPHAVTCVLWDLSRAQSYMRQGATREGTAPVPRGVHFGLAYEPPRLLPYASAAAG